MEVIVKCRKCHKVFTFDTNHKKPIFKMLTQEEMKLEKFVKRCPNCGTLNEVEVKAESEKHGS